MILIISFIVFMIIYSRRQNAYINGEYYKEKQIPYSEVRKDAGMKGEYLIYKNLESYEKKGARFLFNCYIPREQGKTSEIDVIMIYHSGIYVFESKNFSGWIWGNAKQQNWTQTFSSGQKEHFYNPINQNKTHINVLKSALPEVECAYHSIVCFSDRCEFKSIDTGRENVSLIHRKHVLEEVEFIDSKMLPVLGNDDIQRIYEKLYPFTQVSQEVKDMHVYENKHYR